MVSNIVKGLNIEKFVVKKLVMLMTLWMIGKSPKSGYEIIKAFESDNMTQAANASRIYPLLKELEKAGLVEGREIEGKRRTKKYTLTKTGRKQLEMASKYLCSSMKGQFFREMLEMKKAR